MRILGEGVGVEGVVTYGELLVLVMGGTFKDARGGIGRTA